MFFSVVIPVYNVEKYITECVDSILRQTYKDFELILVDDGSQDNSPVICDNYQKRDARVKVIHKLNGGQSSARNAGATIAKGKYIIFIDSDDFILDENAFRKIVDTADEQDIIFYKHCKFIDATKQLKNCTYNYAQLSMEDSYILMLKKMVATDSFFGMAWNKCIRRKLIENNDIKFEEGLLGEDMDWIYQIVTNAKSLSVIDQPFIAYRQRENSITKEVKLKHLSDFVYILKKWYEKIDNGNYTKIEKEVYLGALAKYYSNMLITYVRVNDKNKYQYDKQIKRLSVLLKYGISKRPRMISRIYRIFGFRVTVTALGIVDKIKG